MMYGNGFVIFMMLKMNDRNLAKACLWTPGKVILFSCMLMKTRLRYQFITSAHSMTVFWLFSSFLVLAAKIVRWS